MSEVVSIRANANQRWSDADIEALRLFCRDGKAVEEAARVLRRTDASIKSRAVLLGYGSIGGVLTLESKPAATRHACRRLHAEQVAEIRRKLAKRRPAPLPMELAIDYGCSVRTVIKAITGETYAKLPGKLSIRFMPSGLPSNALATKQISEIDELRQKGWEYHKIRCQVAAGMTQDEFMYALARRDLVRKRRQPMGKSGPRQLRFPDLSNAAKAPKPKAKKTKGLYYIQAGDEVLAVEGDRAAAQASFDRLAAADLHRAPDLRVIWGAPLKWRAKVTLNVKAGRR